MGCKTVIASASEAKADVHLKDGDVLTFGERVRKDLFILDVINEFKMIILKLFSYSET